MSKSGESIMLDYQDPNRGTNRTQRGHSSGRGSSHSARGRGKINHDAHSEFEMDHLNELSLGDIQLEELDGLEDEFNETLEFNSDFEGEDRFEDEEVVTSKNMNRRSRYSQQRRNSSDEEEEFNPRMRNLSLAEEFGDVTTSHGSPEVILEGLQRFTDEEEESEVELEDFENEINILKDGLRDTQRFLKCLRSENEVRIEGRLEKGLKGAEDENMNLLTRAELNLDSQITQLTNSMKSSTKQRESEFNELVQLSSSLLPIYPISTTLPLQSANDDSTSLPEAQSDIENVGLDPNEIITTFSEISSLNNITSSLIMTLASINEKSQINKSKSKEINSKIKSLSTRLSDFNSVEQSIQDAQDYISRFESNKKGRFGQEMKDLLSGIDGLMESAELRAREILA